MSKVKIYGNTLLVSVQSPKNNNPLRELETNIILDGEYEIILMGLVGFMGMNEDVARLVFDAADRYRNEAQLSLPFETNDVGQSDQPAANLVEAPGAGFVPHKKENRDF